MNSKETKIRLATSPSSLPLPLPKHHESSKPSHLLRAYSMPSFTEFEAKNNLQNIPTPGLSRYETDFIELHALGSGGFGTVFKVQNKLDGLTYAMKKIVWKGSEASSALDHILREVKTLARLEHPNVIRYYNAWIEEKSTDPLPEVVRMPKSKQNKPKFQEISLGDQFSSDKSSSSSSQGFEFEKEEDESDISNDIDPWKEKEKRKVEISSMFQRQNITTMYIQMQLCSSETLRDWLLSRSGIDIKQNLVILKQICKGLSYLHSNGIIHRDLKPSNIFFSINKVQEICNSDDQAEAADFIIIGDFGLAVSMEVQVAEKSDSSPESPKAGSTQKPETKSPKSSSPQMNHTGGVGTLTYASPEQISKQNYDEKTDIYSLGIIFFEMFCHFSTGMERAQTLTNLRKNILPPDFLFHYPKESSFVFRLISTLPERRPSADEILKSQILDTREVVVVSKKRWQELHQKLKQQDLFIIQQEAKIKELEGKLNQHH